MPLFDLSAAYLRAVLNGDTPTALTPAKTAAVALVFRRGDNGTELLLIQRAKKPTDPWSGHMAFPGGRTDATDSDSSHTAERETVEEVALDLSSADRLGSLSDLLPTQGRGGLDAVRGHAYWLDGERPATTPNYEVADIVWVPLTVLGDSARYIDHYYPLSESTWPGIQLDNPDQVVWGLTLRFLADLFRRLDTPFIELAPWRGNGR